jgi:hypothetical protein
MKKLPLYIFLALIFCSVSFADELFGIKFGDNINNYTIKKKISDSLYSIKPKILNEDFYEYQVRVTKKNIIVQVDAFTKKKFKTKIDCVIKLGVYTNATRRRLIKSGYDKIFDVYQETIEQPSNFNNYILFGKAENEQDNDWHTRYNLYLMNGCRKLNDHYQIEIHLGDRSLGLGYDKKGL